MRYIFECVVGVIFYFGRHLLPLFVVLLTAADSATGAVCFPVCSLSFVFSPYFVQCVERYTFSIFISIVSRPTFKCICDDEQELNIYIPRDNKSLLRRACNAAVVMCGV